MNLEKRFNYLTKQIIKKLSEHFDGKKDKYLAASIAEYVLRESLWTVCSFLLASCNTFFSTYPLGLALLCGKSKNVLFIYLGCLFSAFSINQGGIGYAICYTLVILLRYAVSKYLCDDSVKIFEEGYFLRTISALGSGFVISVINCFADGFSLSSFGGLIFMSVVPFGLSFLFCGLDRKKSSLHYIAGSAALGFCFVLSMSKFGFFGYSLGIAACSALTVYISLKFDSLSATVISLICGLACGEPILAPMFALVALFYSVTDKVNKKLSLPLGLLFGAIYSFWIFKQNALTYVLPDLLCGSLIIFPIRFFGKSNKNENNEKLIEKDKEIESELNRVSEKLAREDSDRISENMTSLSQMLTTVSDNLKYPGYDEVYRMCENVCTDNCLSCRQKKKCLKKPEENSDVIERLSHTLCETGYITSEDMPRELIDSCKAAKTLAQDINSEYGMLIRSKMTGDKTKAFAYGYGCVAKLIDESTKSRQSEIAVDLKLSEKAAEIAKKLKLDCESIFVFGDRRKTVIAKGMSDIALNISGNSIKKEFSEICALPMSTPYIEYSSGKWRMKLESLPVISCKFTSLSKPKDGEEVCGDTVRSFSSNDGFFYTVLSDGMGSGKQAALVSHICCSFSEKLTLSGGSLKTVVETINNYMLGQNYETSSTLDLMRVDLYQSKVCFVKSGAVSSMILRNGHVFRISSATLPLGVVRDINAEVTSFSVMPGDYIILTSDGVAPDLESCLLIADSVTSKADLPIEAIAQSIINDASSSGRRSDDMSVAIVKIEK